MRARFLAILKSSAGSLSSLLFGALGVKAIAVLLGPNGVGAFSLLKQSLQTFTALATLSGDTALVQGLCSRQGVERDRFLTSALMILILSTCCAAVLALLIVPNVLTDRIGLDGQAGTQASIWLALSIVFAAVSVVMMAILNTKRALGRMAFAQAATALVGAMSAYLLCLKFAKDALAPVLASIAITSCISSAYFVWRSTSATRIREALFYGFDRTQAGQFVSMAGVTLFVGFAGAGTLLVVRLAVADHLGLSNAGLFDASWTLSAVYLVVLLSSFGTYFLPTMSGITDEQTFSTLLQDLFRISIVFCAPIIVFAIVTKPMLLELLYTRDFLDAADMMRWMLIGDYMRVIGWVFSIPMLARKRLLPYLLLTLFWDVIFIAATGVVIWFGLALEYIGAGYVLAQCCFVLCAVIYWRQVDRFRVSNADTLYLFAGLTIIVLSSYYTWDRRSVVWYDLLWLFPVFGFSFFGVKRFYLRGNRAPA